MQNILFKLSDEEFKQFKESSLTDGINVSNSVKSYSNLILPYLGKYNCYLYFDKLDSIDTKIVDYPLYELNLCSLKDTVKLLTAIKCNYEEGRRLDFFDVLQTILCLDSVTKQKIRNTLESPPSRNNIEIANVFIYEYYYNILTALEQFLDGVDSNYHIVCGTFKHGF